MGTFDGDAAVSTASGLVRPARGTRPANRRELILEAAGELFYRNGYPNVGVGDIAEAVAIGPSALYRHFNNKQDLLREVVARALATLQATITEMSAETAPDIATVLATTLLEHRRIGVLWRREARHLTVEARSELRRQIRDIAGELADLLCRQQSGLGAAESDLLAWALLAVATSVSFHNLTVSDELLVQMLQAAMATPIPPLAARGETAAEPGTWSPSRRAAILNAAIHLFAEQGFTPVSMDDIGERVGIAGPSIYNHFSSKAEILAAAITRGNEMLRGDMYRELKRATGPADALERLLYSYTAFVFENADVIRLLTTELGNLEPQEQDNARRMQRDYIAEWVTLLRQVHPGHDPTDARVRVQAALTTVNDIASTPHLHSFENIAACTGLICRRLLDV
ncbi:TetR/AcrR family transcriptional regulator [Skermania sp. ID1734]|uniref:TetR/AcrR family transcriptional regulator n=1 Tax=Skermania sp. ID1734 TaxID=2597516 RepID=UPI00117BFCA8|nr:TetR/AcrR family transcriptional regulator [Skermania sp. ID1734]TSD98059.1 TetR/AcrR family transcriptional regulator [Skermania sp. ID1734]